MPDTIAPPFLTPRLLRGAHGVWYLGGRKMLLLSPAALDDSGHLRPEVERHLADSGVNDPGPSPAYALTVLTATDCNLGCAYCIQNTAPDPTGGSRPSRIDSIWLRRDTAAAIMRFASAKMADSGLDGLDLHLFGGEPLLNPTGCLDLLELAADHGLRSARMTTNGTPLTRTIARKLAARGLDRIQITFDGSQIEHDRSRIRRSGGGTFDRILTNMAGANEATRLQWSLRINVTERNRDGVPEMVEQIAARVDPSRCRITFAMVYDIGVGFTGTVHRDQDLVDAVVGWMVLAGELGFSVSPPKPDRPCLSCSYPDGRFGAVVNADGTLYSCWDAAGRPGWEVGTVEDGYLPAADVPGRWVACGHTAQDTDAAANRWLADAVDTAFLDHLHAARAAGLG